MSSLNAPFTEKFNDNCTIIHGRNLGKSRSQSTPSSPLHAQISNIHTGNSTYGNKLSMQDRKQSLRNSVLINRSGSVDTMSPMMSELSSDVEIITNGEPEDDKKEEGEIDEIEEMDEDLLYLRLMALRSIDLRSEGPKEGKFMSKAKSSETKKTSSEVQCIDVEDMVDEMEDLLNEADQAAKMSPKNINHEDDGIEIIESEPQVIPVIDIPDSDEEQIDLELERWTKNKSISIASLDTTATFQQTTAHNSTGVKNDANERIEEIKFSNEPDYSQLVQRLRQTLERQQKQQNLNEGNNKPLDDECYSPTQSPIRETIRNRYRPKIRYDTNDDHLKYSPTQSPLSEVVDTPIGSGGSTPGNLSPTIPLNIPLSLSEKTYRFESMSDDQLPPLPPGSPPIIKVENDQLKTATIRHVDISQPPPYTPSPLVTNWNDQGANGLRSFTPPPPGEEDSPLDSNCYEKSTEHLNSSVDMEIGSDNEAEIQFFKDQKDQVWNYSEHHSSNDLNKNGFDVTYHDNISHTELRYQPKMSDVLYYENPNDRYNAFLHAVSSRNNTRSNRDSRTGRNYKRKTRKRKMIDSRQDHPVEKRSLIRKDKQKSPISSDQITADRLRNDEQQLNDNYSDEDDPDQLRALLLSDLQKKKDKDLNSKGVADMNKKHVDECAKEGSETDSKAADKSIVSAEGIELRAENLKSTVISNTLPFDSLENNASESFNDHTKNIRNDNANKLSNLHYKKTNSGLNLENEKAQGKKLSAVASKTLEKKLASRENLLLNVSYVGALSELSKLSESTQRLIEEVGPDAIIRNFPNLVKPFVIPLNDVNMHKHVSEKTDAMQNNDLGMPDFASKLDNFMREIRTKSSPKASRKTKVKTTPPPKPARKNIPNKYKVGTGIQTKVLKNARTSSKDLSSSLSPAAKNHLMNASVSSLPRKKQEEYKRLKELIAKKERSRKKSATNNIANKSQPKSKDIPSALKNDIKRRSGDESSKLSNNKTVENNSGIEDEADKLREALLFNMKKHSSGTPSKTINKTYETSTLKEMDASSNKTSFPDTIPSTPMKISVSDTGDRNVHVDESSSYLSDECNLDQRKQLLDSKEKKLGSIRKTVTNDLYKLSAQLSQLKNETNRKKTAEEYLQNLKQKLSEVESLVARKNERILQIKEVVMHSHNEISIKRKEMVRVENECKNIGSEVFGPFYKPPQESSRKIKEKIALIQKHANEIQPEDKLFHNSTTDAGSQKLETKIPGKKTDELNSSLNTNLGRQNDGKPNASSSLQTVNDKIEISETKQKEIGGFSSVGSALAHLRQSGHTNQYDPHKEFCRYELQGKCNDDACEYQHQFPKV